MSNAIIRKPDGRSFSVPVGSIFAILSNAKTSEDNEGKLSFVMTTIAGVTTHFSGMTGDEVMSAVEAARSKRKGLIKAKAPSLVRFDVDDDGCYLIIDQVEGYDEISASELNLFWRHDPNKPCAPVTVSNTEANRKLVDSKKEA